MYPYSGASFDSWHESLDKKFSNIDTKLTTFTNAVKEINEKLTKNMSQMATVLTQNTSVHNEISSCNTRMDSMATQMQTLLDVLPLEIRANYQNSLLNMDTSDENVNQQE